MWIWFERQQEILGCLCYALSYLWQDHAKWLLEASTLGFQVHDFCNVDCIGTLLCKPAWKSQAFMLLLAFCVLVNGTWAIGGILVPLVYWCPLGINLTVLHVSVFSSLVPFMFCWANQHRDGVFPSLQGLCQKVSQLMCDIDLHLCQELMKSVGMNRSWLLPYTLLLKATDHVCDCCFCANCSSVFSLFLGLKSPLFPVHWYVVESVMSVNLFSVLNSIQVYLNWNYWNFLTLMNIFYRVHNMELLIRKV